MKNYLSLEEEIKIVNMRKCGFKTKDIMNLFQIKKHHYYNIISRDGSPKNIPNKKYNQNDEYFSKIDNSTKAYWLGFIFADEYLREYQLSIGLSSKDRSHLESFRDSIESTSKITDKIITKVYKGVKKHYETSSLDLYSIQLYNDLLSYGLHTKKSLTLKPPINLQDEFISHFIRGYFDGDGCISNYKSYKKIKILGTKEFLDWINICFYKNGVSYRRIDKQTNKIFRLQYNTKDCYKIYDYFYNKSEIHLERKKQKFIL
jgi:hypothetical protein